MLPLSCPPPLRRMPCWEVPSAKKHAFAGYTTHMCMWWQHAVHRRSAAGEEYMHHPHVQQQKFGHGREARVSIRPTPALHRANDARLTGVERHLARVEHDIGLVRCTEPPPVGERRVPRHVAPAGDQRSVDAAHPAPAAQLPYRMTTPANGENVSGATRSRTKQYRWMMKNNTGCCWGFSH